jgi:hypothetical protein
MRRLMLLAVVLGLSICAFADPVEFKFIAWNQGQWQLGYPYLIEAQGTSGPTFLAVMCDDYMHGGGPGDIWDANITQLGAGNIMETRFNRIVAGPGALSPLTLYQEAGWILLETQVTPSSEWQSMNYAVWHIFDPNAPLVGDAQMWLDLANGQARMHFPGVDFDKVYVITPVNQYDPDPNGPQEFLALGDDHSLLVNQHGGGTVPEPGTLLMGGTGLLVVLRRKFWS